MSFGVAIPCYVNHYKYIDGLLKNIASSTEKPDRIVISCSSWTDDSRVLYAFEGIPVEILYTKKALNAAQNRNRAAQELKTDLISFVDADDIVHPKRTAFLRSTFAEHPDIEVLYHNYTYDQQAKRYDPFREEESPALLPNKLVKDPKAVGIMVLTDPPNQISHHHAHVTVRRSVFQKFQFPENPQYARMEDSLYGAVLVANQFSVACLQNTLSRYLFGP